MMYLTSTYLMFTTVSSGLPRPKKVSMQKMQQFPHVPVLSVPRPTSLNVLVCCGVVDRVVYMFQNSDSVFLVWSPPTSEDLGLISIFHRFPMRGWKSGLVMINWPPLSPECCSPCMKEIPLTARQCITIVIILITSAVSSSFFGAVHILCEGFVKSCRLLTKLVSLDTHGTFVDVS